MTSPYSPNLGPKTYLTYSYGEMIWEMVLRVKRVGKLEKYSGRYLLKTTVFNTHLITK